MSLVIPDRDPCKKNDGRGDCEYRCGSVGNLILMLVRSQRGLCSWPRPMATPVFTKISSTTVRVSMGRVVEEELASALLVGKAKPARRLHVVSKPIVRTTETASLLKCARVSQDGAGLNATLMSTCALATDPANLARDKPDVDGAMKRSDVQHELDTDQYTANSCVLEHKLNLIPHSHCAFTNN